MLVFVDTTSGSTFSIELNRWDSVIHLKKKIEKSLGIPVSSQELYYNGEALLINDVDLKLCNIVNYSRLLLVLPDEDNYQLLLQPEQSPAPSNIEESLEKNQDWPVTARANNPQMLHQTIPPSDSIEEFVYQGKPVMTRINDDHMLHQTEQSLVPLNAIEGFVNQRWLVMAMSNDDQMLHQTEHSQVPPSNAMEAFDNQGWPGMARSNDDQMLCQSEESPLYSCSADELTDQDMRKMQGYWPATATKGNVNIQESSGRNDNNQDLLQRESSNTFGDLSFGEDRCLSTEHFTNSQSYLPTSTTEDIFINKGQVFQTEQSIVPSNTCGDFSFGEDRSLSTERFTNIQSYLPASTTEAIINKNQVFQTEQSTVLSNTSGDFSFGEDRPLSTESFTNFQSNLPTRTTEYNFINKDQVFQTEQSTVPTNSFGDFTFVEFPLSTERFTNTQSSWHASTTEEINKNQVFQTDQSIVPSNTSGDFSFGEDRPLSTGHFTNIQSYLPASTTEEIINKDQVFQTEKSTVPSNTCGDFSFGEDRRLSTEHFTNSQSNLPTSTTEDISINKDQVLQTEESTVPSNSYEGFSFVEFPLSTERFSDLSYFPAITTGDINNENQVLQTGQTPVPSNSTEERINGTQDLPVRVKSSDQVVQREKSPSIREFINVPDSPVKLTVMMVIYSPENKPVCKFPLNMNASEKVEELRKKLEMIQQMVPLDLPKEGYFFIHKQRMLDNDQSFRWNRVAHGDTIEIFPGHVTN